MDAMDVLWTGGWDSTFRVLELAVIENKRVQPHYIVGPYHSLAQEVIAMTRIRQRVRDTFPTRAANLLPVNMVWGESIPRDEEINRCFQRLKTLVHIGGQYEQLAYFGRYTGKELELCIEKLSGFNADLLLFRDFIRPLLIGKGHECRIEGPLPEPAIKMFTYFRFPVCHLTKAEMRAISEDQGFSDIMELTWFCHYPKHGLPCGKCRPCLMAPATGIKYTFYQQTMWDKISEVKKQLLQRKKPS